MDFCMTRKKQERVDRKVRGSYHRKGKATVQKRRGSMRGIQREGRGYTQGVGCQQSQGQMEFDQGKSQLYPRGEYEEG